MPLSVMDAAKAHEVSGLIPTARTLVSHMMGIGRAADTASNARQCFHKFNEVRIFNPLWLGQRVLFLHGDDLSQLGRV